MSAPSPLAKWFAAFAICTALVAASMAWLDRPVADYVQANISLSLPGRITFHTLGALSIVIVALLALQLWAGARAIGGRPLPQWMDTPLACAWSAVWALSLITVLKHIVGRAQVQTYIHRHAYDFHWLHGSADYEAFPSGTTCVAAAVLIVIGLRAPRLRVACGIALMLTAVGIVITNGHWVSDTIAGAFVGATIGWMTAHMMMRPRVA